MSYRLGSMAFGFLIAFTSGAIAQDDDVHIGRFQAFQGSEIRDKDEGTEDPGVWLLDTATGQIAFCQSGLINMVETDEGYKIGEPRVSCTPWKSPVPDDDPLGIRSELE